LALVFGDIGLFDVVDIGRHVLVGVFAEAEKIERVLVVGQPLDDAGLDAGIVDHVE
jgi:hypothetical protein